MVLLKKKEEINIQILLSQTIMMKYIKKYKEVLSGIKSGIEIMNNNKSGEYDDKLSLNKQLKFLSATIVIRFVFEDDDGKYYPHAHLDDCLYEL